MLERRVSNFENAPCRARINLDNFPVIFGLNPIISSRKEGMIWHLL